MRHIFPKPAQGPQPEGEDRSPAVVVPSGRVRRQWCTAIRHARFLGLESRGALLHVRWGAGALAAICGHEVWRLLRRDDLLAHSCCLWALRVPGVSRMDTIVCGILACPNRSRAFTSRGWAGSVTPGTFLRESASARLQALRSHVPPAHVAAVPRALHLSRALTPGLTGWRRGGGATRGRFRRCLRQRPPGG